MKQKLEITSKIQIGAADAGAVLAGKAAVAVPVDAAREKVLEAGTSPDPDPRETASAQAAGTKSRTLLVNAVKIASAQNAAP
jgi:hypothetical protein